ncbi:MAG: ornithine racemase Orr [Bacillota bacterium]
MYPRVRIDLKKYKHNVETLYQLLKKNRISLMAVSKVFCAEQHFIDILNEVNVDYIADSRLLNLKNMDTSLPKVLLRIPSLHETDDVVLYSDLSLNSEIDTIQALNESAKKHKKVHKIILMIDIGDLREGLYYKELIIDTVLKIKTLDNIKLYGIGTNLTCYGGIIPTKNTLVRLHDVIELIKQTLRMDFTLVSGGNSSHIHLLTSNQHPAYINNLRLGESLILGRETAYGKTIDSLHNDVITLEVDIIEIKKKPSIPEGLIGMDAFGNKPSFKDYGLMTRGILAIGKQDVDYHQLIPEDDDIRLIGSSSDHIIVDLTNTKKDYKLGDIIRFKLSYGSVLSLMTSKYVEKYYV